jgi:hypothetical protein
MNKLVAVLILCVFFACRSGALSVPKSPFYERSMALISTPDLNHTAPATISPYPNAPINLAAKMDIDPRFRRAWYDNGGGERDPAKVGLGLTIAGSILAAIGTTMIIVNANAVEHQAPGGTAGGYHYEYDFFGGLLIAGGLGMLIPGIILLCRKN